MLQKGRRSTIVVDTGINLEFNISLQATSAIRSTVTDTVREALREHKLKNIDEGVTDTTVSTSLA